VAKKKAVTAPARRRKKAPAKKARAAKKPARKRATKPPPPPPQDNVQYPEGLLGDTARAKWREVEPLLRERLSFLGVDHGLLVLYCNCWQRLQQAQTVIATEGMYERVGANGVSAPTAARTDEMRLTSQIRQLGQELGMSLKARKGVKVKSEAGDSLKAFLAGTG
jgi:P27 family predicted phage terminase small subunit